MITKLILTNFKKHESLVADFASGLVALKGANEAGKSSIFHGIVYALFGARALPLSLAETVTYDKPEGSLKVQLEFTFEGGEYSITRSKSGAIITGPDVAANGQSEVTKFVERLFGVNADAATKLMVASQNGLRGALESGEAVPLIEKLANIDLLDRLISKIQDQLPSGNTKSLVESIEQLADLEEPTLNTEDLVPTVEFTKALAAKVESKLQAFQAQDIVDEGLQRTTIASAVAAIQRKTQLEVDLAALEPRLYTPVKPDCDVEQAKANLAKAQEHSARESAWLRFNKLKTCDSTVVDFETEWNNCKSMAEDLTASILNHKLDIASAKSAIITETACGLCGKDLSDVPEVVVKNNANLTRIFDAERHIAALEVSLEECDDLKKRLLNMEACDREAHVNYTVIEKYVTKDSTVYPMKLVWIGDPPEPTTELSNCVAELRQAETLQREYDKAMAVQAELQQRKAKLTDQLADLVIDHKAKREAEGLLQSKLELNQILKATEIDLYKCKANHVAAVNALEKAEQVYATKLEAYSQAMASKAMLEKTLRTTEKNNALIKKLREVRPVVAARLWSIVLSSVSAYFSQIRGEPSTITRSDNTFKVDGKPVAGLSGSTLDALGLAIRMSLGKTFLPSVDFLLLDEPAAGMDEERETAMLGLLASTGYTQVVVVTHSGLADAFATAVVQL